MNALKVWLDIPRDVAADFSLDWADPWDSFLGGVLVCSLMALMLPLTLLALAVGLCSLPVWGPVRLRRWWRRRRP